VDSRFDDTRLGGGSLGRAIGEVGSTARGTARRGRRQLGVGVDLQLDFLILVIVDVVVAPGSGFSSASLPRRRAVVSKGARPWLAASLSKPSLQRWSSFRKIDALVCAVCA